MNDSFVSDIVSVLNNNSSIEEKRHSLMKIIKKRRGNNRKILYLIREMLCLHLPLSIDDKLNFNNMNFLEKDYSILKMVLDKSSFIYFNAICSEVLWAHIKDKTYAIKSINYYMQELKKPSLINDYIHTQLIISICRIYSKYKIKDFDFKSFFQYATKRVVSNYSSKGYSALFILNGLTACKENIDILEKVFEDAISYYELEENFDKANGFLEGLEQFYRVNKNRSKFQNIWIRIATNKEKRAEQYDWSNPQHAHMIISLIQEAMMYWEKVNNENTKEERQRLSRRIIPIKKLSLQTLKLISTEPIDISQYIKALKKHIERATLESCLYSLTNVIPLINCEEISKKNQEFGFISSALFHSIKLDEEGRKKCIIPSIINASKDEMIAIAEHQASEEYKLHADIIFKNFVALAKNRFEFTNESLSFLLDNNIIVSEERKESFLKGIVAGFNLDLITAMHILMPQMEYCIRNLAKECGAVVYKTDKNGIEECLALKSILNSPEVKECLDETFLFNLSLFFESEYGFGMRNEICHGLLSDNEIQNLDSLAVWWFVLRICCMFSPTLYERLEEQNGDTITE